MGKIVPVAMNENKEKITAQPLLWWDREEMQPESNGRGT
jgi:hypothetical protein